MGIINSTTFTEGSTIELSAHVPDVAGTGYTESENTSTSIINVVAGADCGPDADDANENIIYTADDSPTNADVDVNGGVQSYSGTGAEWFGLIARYADNANLYALEFRDTTGNDIRIGKITTAGGAATISSVDSDATGGGDDIIFELRGSTLRGLVNAVEEISVSDSDLSAAGKCGMTWGNTIGSSSDIGQGNDFTSFSIDDQDAGGFVPYPNPRYSTAGGMQNMGGGA